MEHTDPKEKAPLVSIAMCTYNGEQFLREQLDSLIAQDYPNIEIIIVDDCSTDSTFNILKEYQSNHSHIRAMKNPANLGFVKNFEKATSLCSGDYISLCDQDDIWFSHKISQLVDHIGESNLIYSGVQLINEKGQKIKREFLTIHRLSGKCHLGLLFANCVTGHTCLIKRQALNKALPFPEKITVHDHWIALVSAATGGIKAHPETLSLYRQHDSNAILGEKEHHKNKFIKRKQLFNTQMAFIKAARNVDGLPEDDRNLIDSIIVAYGAYTRCFINRKLRKILRRHNEQLLPLYPDKEKAIKRISRGYLKNLI